MHNNLNCRPSTGISFYWKTFVCMCVSWPRLIKTKLPKIYKKSYQETHRLSWSTGIGLYWQMLTWAARITSTSLIKILNVFFSSFLSCWLQSMWYKMIQCKKDQLKWSKRLSLSWKKGMIHHEKERQKIGWLKKKGWLRKLRWGLRRIKVEWGSTMSTRPSLRVMCWDDPTPEWSAIKISSSKADDYPRPERSAQVKQVTEVVLKKKKSWSINRRN